MIVHSTSDVSIYPGVYERAWSEEELNDEIFRTDARIKFPFVSMKQLADHYRIEMRVPGFNKEDFLLFVPKVIFFQFRR